jgi:hypothetical protein
MTRDEFFRSDSHPMTIQLAYSTRTFRREIESHLRVVRGKMVDRPTVAFIECGTGTHLDGEFLYQHLQEQHQ